MKKKNAGIVWWFKKNVYLCSPFRQEEGKSLSGGIGRRVGLKHQWGKTRIGSIPISGTAKPVFQRPAFFYKGFCLFEKVDIFVFAFHQISFPAEFFHEFRVGENLVDQGFIVQDVFLVIVLGPFQLPQFTSSFDLRANRVGRQESDPEDEEKGYKDMVPVFPCPETVYVVSDSGKEFVSVHACSSLRIFRISSAYSRLLLSRGTLFCPPSFPFPLSHL